MLANQVFGTESHRPKAHTGPDDEAENRNRAPHQACLTVPDKP